MSDHDNIALVEVIFDMEHPVSRDRILAIATVLGHSLSDDQLIAVTDEVSRIYEVKNIIYRKEISCIIEEALSWPEKSWKIHSVNVCIGRNTVPTASVSLISPDGKDVQVEATGASSVDAICAAIEGATKINVYLLDFRYGNVVHSANSLGLAKVRVKHHSFEVTTGAYSIDVIEAAAKAFLIAINTVLKRLSEQY